MLAVLLMAPALALEDVYSLEAVVAESDLVARVRVLGVEPVTGGDPPNRFAEARVEIVEAFRGARKGEVVRLRFDRWIACPRVTYAAGEECLLFAEEDFDGAFETVRFNNGKRPIDAGYPALAAQVRQLRGEMGEQVSLDGLLSLRLLRAAGALRAEDAVLEVRVENRGQEPLVVANGLRSEVRYPLRERLRDTECRVAQSALEVKPIFQVENSAGAGKLLRAESKLSHLTLRPGEACEASITLAEALPDFKLRHRLKVWASAGGRRSDSVGLEADFGVRPEAREAETTPAGEVGPFRKVGFLHDLLRFARGNALVLGLFAAALLLVVLAKIGTATDFRRRRKTTK